MKQMRCFKNAGPVAVKCKLYLKAPRVGFLFDSGPAMEYFPVTQTANRPRYYLNQQNRTK